MVGAATGPNLVLQLLPYIIMASVAYVFAIVIGKRKGVSPLACLQVFIPAWGYFFLFWLVSRTDTAVLRRLEAFEAASGVGRGVASEHASS